MKTFFAIALNCVYLTLAVGVAKTTHYCMGRENHTSHFSFDVDPCACFKVSSFMGDASDCCQDESVLLQLNDDQAATAQLIIAQVGLPFIFEFEFLVANELQPSINKEFSPEKFLRPPPLRAYIKNCSLII